jgi:uncharacterized membrane protein YfcA
MEILILILSGIIGGVIAGMLGLGGGIFYIIILPYVVQVYGVNESNISAFVIANSLIGISFASFTSLLTELKHIKVYWQESLFLGIPAVFISLITTKYIVQSSWFSVEIFNILVVILMVYILTQMLFKKKTKANDQKLHIIPATLSGSFAGLVSALSGLGGGIIIIPLLQIFQKQSVRKAKLISLVVIFLTSCFISIQNLISIAPDNPEIDYQIGYILPAIVVPLVFGVLIGSPLGVKLSYKMKDEYINILFSVFVVIVLVEKLLLFFQDDFFFLFKCS